MKHSMKVFEGLAIGMIIGGTAGAFLASKIKGNSDYKRRFTNALKSACGFIEDICS